MTSSVGHRLESARKDKGYSRSIVAERLGMSVSAIQAQENGRNNPDPDLLARYSKLYSVSIDWIVTGAEAPTAEIVDIWSRIHDQHERDAWLNMGKALTDKKA